MHMFSHLEAASPIPGIGRATLPLKALGGRAFLSLSSIRAAGSACVSCQSVTPVSATVSCGLFPWCVQISIFF